MAFAPVAWFNRACYAIALIWIGGSLSFSLRHWLIEATDRDALRAHLSAAGVGTIIQWGGKAVHQFAGLRFRVSLPKTDRMFQRCLMLPMNMTVTLDDVEYIALHIRKFYGA